MVLNVNTTLSTKTTYPKERDLYTGNDSEKKCDIFNTVQEP